MDTTTGLDTTALLNTTLDTTLNTRLDTTAIPSAEHDPSWKQIVSRYPHRLLALGLPQLGFDKKMNWDTRCDSPLAFPNPLVPKQKDTRYADIVLKVLDEDHNIEHFNIEIQANYRKSFAQRVFDYAYLLWRRDGKWPISVAFLIGDDGDWRPDGYAEIDAYRSVRFRFWVISVLDWEGREDELENSQNPMALLILARLAVIVSNRGTPSNQGVQEDTKKRRRKKQGVQPDVAYRLERKKHLLSKIIRDYPLETDEERSYLIRYLDWIIELTGEYMTAYKEFAIQQKKKIPFVSTFEIIARQEGKLEGKQEGKQEGKLEGRQETLRQILEKRFGALSPEHLTKISGFSEEQLKVAVDRALDATTLAAVLE